MKSFHHDVPTCKHHSKLFLRPLSIFRTVEKAHYLLSTSSTVHYKLYIGITDINRKISLCESMFYKFDNYWLYAVIQRAD
jgi:hypothetical protein